MVGRTAEREKENRVTNMSLKIIIIGGVAAGPKVAAKIMRLNPDADVTVPEKLR